MPAYNYRCRTCGEVQESIADWDDRSDIECRVCGSETAQRLLSMPMVFEAALRDGNRRFAGIKEQQLQYRYEKERDRKRKMEKYDVRLPE